MRALVAGGAGFVGAHLCRRLVTLGYDVTCVDNLVTGSLANLTGLESEPLFRFVERDVVIAPCEVVDVVFHLASPASPVDFDRLALEILMANSAGTQRLLDVARASGARFVYASTSEIYGDPAVHPQYETYHGDVDSIGPRSCYDEGKRFGEALTVAYARAYGVRSTIARIFNTYGPGMRRDDGRVVAELIGAALAGRSLPVHGTGLQTRSFMYVSDLVDALVLLASRNSTWPVYNVGSTREVTMVELAELVRALVDSGLSIEYVSGRIADPRRRRPDISRIASEYGWAPRVDLIDGLARTIAEMRLEGVTA